MLGMMTVKKALKIIDWRIDHKKITMNVFQEKWKNSDDAYGVEKALMDSDEIIIENLNLIRKQQGDWREVCFNQNRVWVLFCSCCWLLAESTGRCRPTMNEEKKKQDPGLYEFCKRHHITDGMMQNMPDQKIRE